MDYSWTRIAAALTSKSLADEQLQAVNEALNARAAEFSANVARVVPDRVIGPGEIEWFDRKFTLTPDESLRLDGFSGLTRAEACYCLLLAVEASNLEREHADDRLTDSDIESLFLSERIAKFKILTILFIAAGLNSHPLHTPARQIVLDAVSSKSWTLSLIDCLIGLVDATQSQYDDFRSNAQTCTQIQILRVLFMILYDWVPCTSEIVEKWFVLMQKSDFFAVQFTSDETTESPRLAQQLYFLGQIVTLEIVSLRVEDLLARDASDKQREKQTLWWESQDIIAALHQTIVRSANCTIVKFEWGAAMDRLVQNFGNDPDSISSLPALFEVAQDAQNEYQKLISDAIDNGFFAQIISALKSFEEDSNIIGYKLVIAPVLEASFDYVSYSPVVVGAASELISNNPAYLESRRNSKQWQRLTDAILAAFPIDSESLLTFAAAMSSVTMDAFEMIRDCRTVSSTLPSYFTDYEVVSEVALTSAPLIALTKELAFLPVSETVFDESLLLPLGCRGRIMSKSSRQPVVVWQFECDGWNIIGRMLENDLDNLDNEMNCSRARLTVKLLANLLTSNAEIADSAISAIEDALASSDSIVELLGKKFNMAIASCCSRSCTQLVAELLRFFELWLKVSPEEIWTVLVDGPLLSPSGFSRCFGRIINDFEITEYSYKLMLACCQFGFQYFESLLQGSLRNVNFSKDLLLNFSKAFLEFEVGLLTTMDEWHFADESDRSEGKTLIFRTISFIVDLRNLRTFKASTIPSWNALDACSELVLRRHFFVKENSSIVRPFAETLRSISKSDFFNFFDLDKIRDAKIDSVVHCIKCVRAIITSRSLFAAEITNFERQIFRMSSCLIEILHVNAVLDKAIMGLLDDLTSNQYREEPPSLLAHTIHKSNMFVKSCHDILNDRLFPLTVKLATWRFLSSVLIGKQRGLAYILTSTQQTQLSKSIIQLAEDIIGREDPPDSEYLVAVLEFLQQYRYHWALYVDSNSEMKPALSDALVRLLKLASKPQSSFNDIKADDCLSLDAAAFAAMLLASEFFIQCSRKNTAALQRLFNSVKGNFSSLSEPAMSLRGYRASLHANLAKNFKSKWPRLSLNDFECVRRSRREYGDQYCYRLDIISLTLGTDSKSSETYMREIADANINISYLDSQAALLRAWTVLALCLSDAAPLVPDIFDHCGEFARQCLRLNGSEKLDIPFMDSLINERSRTAFKLFLKLEMLSQLTVQSRHDFFELSWQALLNLPKERMHNEVLSSKDGLLQIICVCLRHDLDSSASQQASQVQKVLAISEFYFGEEALAIFGRILRKDGNNGGSHAVADLRLMSVILENVQRQPVYMLCRTQFAENLAKLRVVPQAVNLVTYFKMQDIEALSALEAVLQYLSVLTGCDICATQLTQYRILEVFVECKIGRFIQRGSLERHPTLHRLWSQLILPISINLLRHLGERIRTDIEMFFRAFRTPLREAFDPWINRSAISTLLVDEITFTVVLMKMMQAFDNASGLDDKLKSSVDYLLSHPMLFAKLLRVTSDAEQKVLDNDNSASGENPLSKKLKTDLQTLYDIL